MIVRRRRRTDFGLMRIFGALVARQRADHHIDAAPDEFRRKIGIAVGRDLTQKFVDDLEADFRVRHFATAEFERDLHFHVLAEKIHRVRDLDAEVVRVNPRAELNLFDGRGVLMLLGILFLLGHFVTVFAEIHEPADRRRGGGGDLDEVNPALSRKIDRVVQRDDAELFAVNCDDPDFAGADFAVDPDKRSRRIIAWGIRAAQDTLVGCGITVSFRIKQTGTASSNLLYQ